MSVDLEFIIQKEGDHAWLPLESSSVEILVGRYQLIAQASEAHYPINVHLQHQYIQDDLWQEEVQQHLLQTDVQGRIEILPPTFLASGRWVITCEVPEAVGTAATEHRIYTIQLQVLQQDADLDQEWEFNEAILTPQSLPQPMGPEDSWPRLTPIFTPASISNANEGNLKSVEDQIEAEDAEHNGTKEAASEPALAVDSLIEPHLGDAYHLFFAADLTSEEDLSLATDLGVEDKAGAEEPPMQNPEPRESWSVESRLVSDDEPLIEQNLDYEQSLESLGEDLDPALSAPPLPDFTSDRLELPEIPVEVPPLRLQISPGLILPPELYSPTPEEKEGYRPQLPTFPHLNHWQELSFSELSLALGRLRWSKIDAYGETIDLDFHSLALQQRFLETLNSLAANDQAPEDLEILWDGEAQSVEDEDAIAQDRLEASQSVAVPSSSSEPG